MITYASNRSEKLPLDRAKGQIAGFHLHYFEYLESTMNEAFDREASGITVYEGDVFIAGRQSGTGSRGPWHTGPADIAMTCVLGDASSVSERYLSAAAAGMAVIDAVESFSLTEMPKLYFKWPNDVFTGANQKLCGTMSTSKNDPERTKWLTEKQGLRISNNWLLIGIGVNLGSISKSVSDRYEPISIEDITGRILNKEDVIRSILIALANSMEMLANDRTAFVSKLYMRLLLGKSGHVMTVPPGIEPPESDVLHQTPGRVVGVTEQGFVIERNGSTRLINFDRLGRIVPMFVP